MIPLEDIQENGFWPFISNVIGWIYFFSWSLSFYPQVYENWKRQSVVGLSFDFELFNILGYICYSSSQVGIFWVPAIQDEYYRRYGPPLPVHFNDVFFCLHGILLTGITIYQCLGYYNGKQKNSMTCLFGCAGIVVMMFILSILCVSGKTSLEWLDVFMYFSYTKVALTCFKYAPQVYMNYQRKSTVGWSIGNIYLDFTGGFLSFMQMVVDAAYSGNWYLFIGDPAKLGLSIVTFSFDIFFFIQHYVLYPKRDDPDRVHSIVSRKITKIKE